MSVLVDTARFAAHGRLWAHLASDTSLAELHGFAARLGVPPGAFEGDHYDVPSDVVEAAVALGAVPVSTRDVLRALQRSGLRTRKRRGEKVLQSREEDGARVDVVRAARVPEPHGRHVLLTLTAGALTATRVDDVATGEVLGFLRRWSTEGGTTSVVHDGVLAAPGTRDAAAAAQWWDITPPP